MWTRKLSVQLNLAHVARNENKQQLTGNRLGHTVRCGRPPLLLPSCRKLEFRLSASDGLGSGMGKW